MVSTSSSSSPPAAAADSTRNPSNPHNAAHFVTLVVAAESAGLIVECFDLCGDGEVLVGDGLVGDACVNHCHGKGFVFYMRVIFGRSA
jgi:hypothetical protein